MLRDTLKEGKQSNLVLLSPARLARVIEYLKCFMDYREWKNNISSKTSTIFHNCKNKRVGCSLSSDIQ